MASILILSSHVAASPVGGTAQARVLAALGYETILAPTVLFGRHPGLGAPGGGAVSATDFEGMLQGIEASGAYPILSGLITGYFANPAQIITAAAAIDAARLVNPGVKIIVDPIMGDSGKGLYVGEAVADAIAAHLIPRADLVAPNAWELGRLTDRNVADTASALAAARALGRPVMVSSIPLREAIGVVYVAAVQAWFAGHRRLPSAPNGTGDRLTAVFAAGWLAGRPPRAALHAAVTSVAEWVSGAPIDVTVEAVG